MGFLRSVWDGIITFLKALGRGIIALFKFIIAVVCGLIICISSIYAGIWNLIKSGAKKVFLMMFKKPDTSTDTVSEDMLESLKEHINTARRNGEIKNLPVDWDRLTILSVAADTDGTVTSTDHVKVLNMEEAENIAENSRVMNELRREKIVCLS